MRPQVMAITPQLLYQRLVRGVTVKPAGKEKRSRRFMLLQCPCNGGAPFSKFIGSKYQRQLALRAVSPDDSAMAVHSLAGPLRLRLVLLRSQQVYQAGSAIHGRLVGGVVAKVIVVNSKI